MVVRLCASKGREIERTWSTDQRRKGRIRGDRIQKWIVEVNNASMGKHGQTWRRETKLIKSKSNIKKVINYKPYFKKTKTNALLACT